MSKHQDDGHISAQAELERRINETKQRLRDTWPELKAIHQHTPQERAEEQRVVQALQNGNIEELARCAQELSHFPNGSVCCAGPWLDTAIGCGSITAIKWMIARGLDLAYRDGAANTALHTAMEREPPEKYEVLDFLLRAGAPHNLHGLNNWTAVHMAASRNDVEALKFLRRHGADPTAIRHDFSDSTPS